MFFFFLGLRFQPSNLKFINNIHAYLALWVYISWCQSISMIMKTYCWAVQLLYAFKNNQWGWKNSSLQYMPMNLNYLENRLVTTTAVGYRKYFAIKRPHVKITLKWNSFYIDRTSILRYYYEMHEITLF